MPAVPELALATAVLGSSAGKGLPKAYMHNGVFKSLKQVVHFYNTRAATGTSIVSCLKCVPMGNFGLTPQKRSCYRRCPEGAKRRVESERQKVVRLVRTRGLENSTSSPV